MPWLSCALPGAVTNRERRHYALGIFPCCDIVCSNGDIFYFSKPGRTRVLFRTTAERLFRSMCISISIPSIRCSFSIYPPVILAFLFRSVPAMRGLFLLPTSVPERDHKRKGRKYLLLPPRYPAIFPASYLPLSVSLPTIATRCFLPYPQCPPRLIWTRRSAS